MYGTVSENLMGAWLCQDGRPADVELILDALTMVLLRLLFFGGCVGRSRSDSLEIRREMSAVFGV